MLLSLLLYMTRASSSPAVQTRDFRSVVHAGASASRIRSVCWQKIMIFVHTVACYRYCSRQKFSSETYSTRQLLFICCLKQLDLCLWYCMLQMLLRDRGLTVTTVPDMIALSAFCTVQSTTTSTVSTAQSTATASRINLLYKHVLQLCLRCCILSMSLRSRTKLQSPTTSTTAPIDQSTRVSLLSKNIIDLCLRCCML